MKYKNRPLQWGILVFTEKTNEVVLWIFVTQGSSFSITFPLTYEFRVPAFLSLSKSSLIVIDMRWLGESTDAPKDNQEVNGCGLRIF